MYKINKEDSPREWECLIANDDDLPAFVSWWCAFSCMLIRTAINKLKFHFEMFFIISCRMQIKWHSQKWLSVWWCNWQWASFWKYVSLSFKFIFYLWYFWCLLVVVDWTEQKRVNKALSKKYIEQCDSQIGSDLFSKLFRKFIIVWRERERER